MEMLRNPYIRKGLAGAAAILALAGCEIGRGAEILPRRPAEVVAHEYHPPYTTIFPAGKILIPIFHPAEYHLDLQQCDRSRDEYADRQGCVAAHVQVYGDTYEKFADGSTITLRGDS